MEMVAKYADGHIERRPISQRHENADDWDAVYAEMGFPPDAVNFWAEQVTREVPDTPKGGE